MHEVLSLNTISLSLRYLMLQNYYAGVCEAAPYGQNTAPPVNMLVH